MIPNCEKFCLILTTSILGRTLLCHMALLEDLFNIDGYDFVLTARIRSDLIERTFAQYR